MKTDAGNQNSHSLIIIGNFTAIKSQACKIKNDKISGGSVKCAGGITQYLVSGHGRNPTASFLGASPS